MSGKLMSLVRAAEIVEDGMLLAFGGNTLHRAPMAFVRQLARKGKRDLRLVKTAGAHEIDLLCAAGCVKSIDAGFVSYETLCGLAGHYRAAVQNGAVTANEHACYTVICALRAAASGVPFMPVRGLVVSDLLRVNPALSVLDDPFGSGPCAVVKAIAPDITVIHAHSCDEEGNAIIEGSRFDDEIMVRAAKTVIVTAEKIISPRSKEINPDNVTIPGFMVKAVVYAPNGAAPCACYGRYKPDIDSIRRFHSVKTPEELAAYLKVYEKTDAFSEGGRYYADIH